MTAELVTEYVEIGSLVPADRNPKRHEMAGIKASMRRFGLYDNIGQVDGRTGKLYGGHGRVQGLRDMHRAKEDPPRGVIVEGDTWLVPVLSGWSSSDDAEAEAVLVGANAHTMAGGWDNELRDAILIDLHADEAAWSIDELGFPRWPDDDDAEERKQKLPTLGWKVVIDCNSEEEQTAVLTEVIGLGYSATAVFT